MLAVLAVQVALTVHGLVAYGPSGDEALYLRAGSEEWAHWLTHASLAQNFSFFFSGALFLWPPLGAIGYQAGGMVGARVISMIFMLGVTAFTYFTGLRMGGRLVAGFAAALAGLTGLLDYLGASATFEPLALFFLMLAVCLVARADGGWWWLAAAGPALALSNAAKYGTIAWDPVVVGIAVLYGWESWKPALRRGLILAACLPLGMASYYSPRVPAPCTE